MIIEPDYPQFLAYQTTVGKGCYFLDVYCLDGKSLAPEEEFMAF